MVTCNLQRTVRTRLPTGEGEFQLIHYGSTFDQKDHVALVMGDLDGQENVLVRIHSECFTGDVFGSQRCDCGEQLHVAMQMIAAEGRGVVIYLRQEGRGIGLQKKLQAYNLQDEGHDTVDANLLLGHQADERTYETAVAILQDLGITSLRLLTNNPTKIEQLRNAGLIVLDRIPLVPTVHAENRHYLATKVQRMRHLLTLPIPKGERTHTSVNGVDTHRALPLTATALIADLQERAAAYYAHVQLPFVTLSYAQSIDGSIAAMDRTPLHISSSESMTLTHMLRATHDAILVGVGTVIADDPKLTVRLVPGDDPQPIILDSQLRTPRSARCLQNARRPWLATTRAAKARRPLTDLDIELLPVDADLQGRVALSSLLRQLTAKGVRSVMVEGGATVLRSFLQARWAQAAVVTIAPFFAGGLPALSSTDSGMAPMAAFPRLLKPQLLQLEDDTIYYGHFVDE